MEKSIKNLKYAIYNEWSCDPPAGEVTLYYDARGEKFSDVYQPVLEICSNLGCQMDEDEIEEFEEICEQARDNIESFSWDNGGIGCGCDLFAEGKDIASKAAEFFEYSLDLDDILYEYSEDKLNQEKEKASKIIQSAVENPEDYDSVIALLDLVSKYIQIKNSSMY